MRILAAAALAAFAIACTPTAPTAPVSSARAPAANEISIAGEIGEVEDAGYPQFIVHVKPQRGRELALYLNAEGGAELGGAAPGSFAGQSAIVYYTSTQAPSMIDMRTGTGRSLIYDDGRGVPTEGDAITGVLSGANGVTAGDLPDEITITPADGAAMSFRYYVDRRIAAWNGREVTVHYVIDPLNEITLMQALGQP
jgi:hypothetical protein